MTRLAAMAAALLLVACNHITPGLTLKCDGRCHLYPANLHHQDARGDRPAD